MKIQQIKILLILTILIFSCSEQEKVGTVNVSETILVTPGRKVINVIYYVNRINIITKNRINTDKIDTTYVEMYSHGIKCNEIIFIEQ